VRAQDLGDPEEGGSAAEHVRRRRDHLRGISILRCLDDRQAPVIPNQQRTVACPPDEDRMVELGGSVDVGHESESGGCTSDVHKKPLRGRAAAPRQAVRCRNGPFDPWMVEIVRDMCLGALDRADNVPYAPLRCKPMSRSQPPHG
jgi:hypothetical protein